MKIDYFDLLSPEPLRIQGVGGILSPKLKDISSIGINTYQYYLTILLMDLKTCFTMLEQEESFQSLSAEAQISVFDLLTVNNQLVSLLECVLNFFIEEEVVYSTEHKMFLVQKNHELIGTITKEKYPQVCNLICQRICIQTDREDDVSRVKNKKALEIMKKLRQGRAEKAKRTKADKNMELGNIISAVANKSQSLNIINIWELTVYQVWDCFLRLSNNSVYDIQSMSVAAWGNKDNTFDTNAWFKKIEINN